MAELTLEQIAEAARRFGVSGEHIEKMWAELQADPESAENQLMELLGDTERDVDTLVASAQTYLEAAAEDRLRGLFHFYLDSWSEVDPEQFDMERTLQLLVVAAWKLAEAQNREASLLDGSRRQSKR